MSGFSDSPERQGSPTRCFCDAADRANWGLIDADLGSGVVKQRVARTGYGRSGGFRTLLFFRADDRAIFVFGFAKKDKSNIDAGELAALREAAKTVLTLSQAAIDAE